MNFKIYSKIKPAKTSKNTTNVESKIEVEIDGKIYDATLENNETSKAFLDFLPMKFEMHELNGNEKYVYMTETLPTNPSNPKYIVKGDIMLYSDDCLVTFINLLKHRTTIPK